MKRKFAFITFAFLILASLTAHVSDGMAQESLVPGSGNKVVVADRGSGTISIISSITDELIGTYNLPYGNFMPEPMYVVYSAAKHRVFVGDRANDRVVLFNARNFSYEGDVEAGAGVFHMWADRRNKQLWVNNDIDNTSTVINPNTLEVMATVPTPADLVAMGGKPHDVILDSQGRYAYITVVGLPGDEDYVVQFRTDTFEEVGRAPVGKDPHLSLARQHQWLYVPCQGSDAVYVLDRLTLEDVTIITVPGAHGAGMSRNGKYFYATNLPGGGTDGLYVINTRTNEVVGTADTPYMVPHNIALRTNSHKLFVTHSGGTSDKVTIYTMSGKDPVPVYSGEVTVGLNPFGLTHIP